MAISNENDEERLAECLTLLEHLEAGRIITREEVVGMQRWRDTTQRDVERCNKEIARLSGAGPKETDLQPRPWSSVRGQYWLGESTAVVRDRH